MTKKVADASFLVSAIRSNDMNHWGCYSYLKSHEHDEWYIPAIAYFEYQALQSRMQKCGDVPHLPLYLPNNWRIYNVDAHFLRKTNYRVTSLFPNLKGADLVYACICYVENMTLVTCDFDFDSCSKYIEVINPLRENAYWWRGEIEIVIDNGKFRGDYKVHGALPLITVQSGKASTTTHLGRSSPKSLARILLRELAQAGRAKRVGGSRDEHRAG